MNQQEKSVSKVILLKRCQTHTRLDCITWTTKFGK